MFYAPNVSKAVDVPPQVGRKVMVAAQNKHWSCLMRSGYTFTLFTEAAYGDRVDQVKTQQ